MRGQPYLWRSRKPRAGWKPIPNHPLRAGLVLDLPLNDGGGTTALDYSGLGNDGTLTVASTWAAGRDGPALSFDGSTAYSTCGAD